MASQRFSLPRVLQAGCKSGYITPRTIRRQGVAAEGSRRVLSAAKAAPTAVGGYLKCPGQDRLTLRGEKVLRRCPTAPPEVVQCRTFRMPLDPRGALRTALPTNDRVGQHARQSAHSFRSEGSANCRRRLLEMSGPGAAHFAWGGSPATPFAATTAGRWRRNSHSCRSY